MSEDYSTVFFVRYDAEEISHIRNITITNILGNWIVYADGINDVHCNDERDAINVAESLKKVINHYNKVNIEHN